MLSNLAWLRISPICVNYARRFVNTLPLPIYIKSRHYIGYRNHLHIVTSNRCSLFNVKNYSQRTAETPNVEYDQLLSGLRDGSIVLIDVRDAYELDKFGRFYHNTINIPHEHKFNLGIYDEVNYNHWVDTYAGGDISGENHNTYVGNNTESFTFNLFVIGYRKHFIPGMYGEPIYNHWVDTTAGGGFFSEVDQLPEAFNMSPEHFKVLYGYDLPELEDNIVFVCRSGERSSSAVEMAIEYGYENAKHFPGGLSEWQKGKASLQSSGDV